MMHFMCKFCSDYAQDKEVKARTLEHIIAHLEKVRETEPRRREQMRAGIALKNIRACMEKVRETEMLPVM